jgi:hypothetical protein
MPDPAKHGLFKIKMGFITQHCVRLMFEPYGPFEVAEDHYRQQGYEPEFDALPWQDEPKGNLPAPVIKDQSHTDNDAIALDAVTTSDPVDHESGWLEQSIARLATLRAKRKNQG